MRSSSQPFFPDLSQEAQIWITSVDGPAEDLNKILNQIQVYLPKWTSHGRSVLSSAMVHEVTSQKTQVFNPGIHTLAQLRGGEFERPLSESVYAQMFRVSEAIL